MAGRLRFAGIDFDQTGLAGVLAWLAGRSHRDGFAYVVTPNVDHAVRLADNPGWHDLHQAYARAGLILCDSRILRALARLRGMRLDVVPGSDLTRHFLIDHLPEGSHLLLLGGQEGAASLLQAMAPQARITQHCPPMGLLRDAQAMAGSVEAVVQARADFVLLAVGSPQQELLASRLAMCEGLGGTGLCIGASVDFLTGHARRAPVWMQRLSLEWLHRLLHDPRRLWRRYLIDGPRILRIAFAA